MALILCHKKLEMESLVDLQQKLLVLILCILKENNSKQEVDQSARKRQKHLLVDRDQPKSKA